MPSTSINPFQLLFALQNATNLHLSFLNPKSSNFCDTPTSASSVILPLICLHCLEALKLLQTSLCPWYVCTHLFPAICILQQTQSGLFCVCPAVNKAKGFNVRGLQETILAINIRIKCSNITTPDLLLTLTFSWVQTQAFHQLVNLKVCCHVQ